MKKRIQESTSMRILRQLFWSFALIITAILSSCSDDEDVSPPEVFTSDFENIETGSAGFLNGSSKDGDARTEERFGQTVTVYTKTFKSGAAAFPNTFISASFDSWSGWSVSSLGDNTSPGFGNQYSAFPGSGSGGSANFGLAFGDSVTVSLVALQGLAALSVDVANSTYTALSMRDGDSFSKQFGGPGGTDPDFLKLTISGIAANGSTTGSVEVYLADYRSSDPSEDYILDRWEEVDLRPLGQVSSLQFTLASSDVGAFGINTPTYFCLDNLRLQAID